MNETIKFIDMVILSYAEKYKDIDFFEISKYINSSKSFLACKTQCLIDYGYIVVSGEQMSLTDNAKKLNILKWDILRNILTVKTEAEEEFIWDDIYIPRNFKIQ